MKTWKKNVMAAAVLVTVCAGIYLNWLYTEDKATADLTDTLDAQKVLSSDTLVMANDAEPTTVTDYFAAVRLSRQEARSYADSTAATESSVYLDEIVQVALCEAQIESLVIAKGYADCVAYISDNGISVAVATPEGGMQPEDVAVIADIVISQSEFSMDDIHVVEVQ